LAKEAVLAHLKEEKEAEKEIYPAFAGFSVMGDEGNQADKSELNHSCIISKVAREANISSLQVFGVWK
jgi:hypothetical protein